MRFYGYSAGQGFGLRTLQCLERQLELGEMLLGAF
jgi:hypothetical protein